MLLVAAITLRFTAGVERTAQKLKVETRRVQGIFYLLVVDLLRLKCCVVVSSAGLYWSQELYCMIKLLSVVHARVQLTPDRYTQKSECSADDIQLDCIVAHS